MGWVAFDDDSLKSLVGCDGGMVFYRDGAGIEEAAAVVELDVTGRRKPVKGESICAGIAPMGTASQRVLPEVAHQAAPGTFAVGEKNGRYRSNFA